MVHYYMRPTTERNGSAMEMCSYRSSSIRKFHAVENTQNKCGFAHISIAIYVNAKLNWMEERDKLTQKKRKK